MIDIKEVQLQWFISFLIKVGAEVGAVKNKMMRNNELAEELYKTIIRKFEFEKQNVHSSFIDNIWGDLGC